TAAGPTSGCPALQFTIGSYQIAVDASTQFSGGSCANLAVGTRIHARGGLGANGTVLLTQVTILGGGGSGQGSGQNVAGRGVVTAIGEGSSCASGGSVTVSGYTVLIDAATQFVSGACSDVKPGVTLDVVGYFVSETTVRATQIAVVR